MKLELVPTLDILDLDTMRQLMDLDEGGLGLLTEMYGLFRDDTPPRIVQLEAALQAGNHDLMGDMAHAVKGAASTMGAPRVRALAQILESAGRQHACEGSPAEVLVQLKAEFGEALKALEGFIASRS